MSASSLSVGSKSGPSSPRSENPASPKPGRSVTPAFEESINSQGRATTSAVNAAVITWVMNSGECNSEADIKKHYKSDAISKDIALLVFEVCISTKSWFAKHRDDWGPKQTLRVAVAHVEGRPKAEGGAKLVGGIKSIEEAENVLAAFQKKRDLTGMKHTSKGSLENIAFAINLDTVSRFVRSLPTGSTESDVKAEIESHYFDSKKEQEAALRMWEVLAKPDGHFTKLKQDWDDELLMKMAKKHAASPLNTPEEIVAAVHEIITSTDKLSSRPTVFQPFVG